jgi:DNA polymerase I-like protein with 3'-5' exonuclease and polymerase domains
LTGFRLEGVFGRKDVINYPVQGSAFHCLLRCLIKVVKWLKRNKMASLVIGQIHDSKLGDVHEDELQEYLTYCHHVMTEELPAEWQWLIVPLEVGFDVAPAGGSWYDKVEHKYDKDAGLWLPAKA